MSQSLLILMIQSSSFPSSIFLILSSVVEKNREASQSRLCIVTAMYAFSKQRMAHLIFEYHVHLLQCVNMGPNITHHKGGLAALCNKAEKCTAVPGISTFSLTSPRKCLHLVLGMFYLAPEFCSLPPSLCSASRVANSCQLHHLIP